MKSIMKGIFDGTLDPSGEIICQDPRYYQLWAIVDKEEAWLLNQLTPEAVERYTLMQEHISEALSMNIYAGYAYGLRLGVRLSLELLEPQHPCE